MGKMSELQAEIVELLEAGEGTEVIAKRLNIPYEWVTDVEEWACGYQDDGQPTEYELGIPYGYIEGKPNKYG
jgi:hypothetical protein